MIWQDRKERNPSEYYYCIDRNGNRNPVPLTKSNFMTKSNFLKRKWHSWSPKTFKDVYLPFTSGILNQKLILPNVQTWMEIWLVKSRNFFSIFILLQHWKESLVHFWTKRKWKMVSLKITHFRCIFFLQYWKALRSCFWSKRKCKMSGVLIWWDYEHDRLEKIVGQA